ncbi:MAG: small multi-drug export protein [Clostridia bacterium]|nr:small multi-drug export protein [Clostridia bacterium]MDY2714204.1 small multi-drug export protein [Christensenellaceae bacterium]
MTEALGEFLLKLFGGNTYAATLFVSMFPLIELKGAIPIGTGLFGMPLWQTSLVAYLGSTIVSVAEFFLLIPVFNLLKRISFIKKLVLKVEGIFARKAEEIAKKTEGSAEKEAKKIMLWSLFVFVAVPFPVTGVWTGTAIAVFLGLKFHESVLPIAAGNLVAGGIITLLTFLLGEKYTNYLIYALFVIALIMLVVFIVKIVRSEPKAESANGSEDEK